MLAQHLTERLVDDELVDLRLKTESRRRNVELDATGLIERILREDGSLIDVDPLEHLIDRREEIAVDGIDPVEDAAGEIRYVLQSRPVVPAVSQVCIVDCSADVANRSVGLNRRGDHLIAELIAEEGRYTAGHARPEWTTGDDADRGLAERVERE